MMIGSFLNRRINILPFGLLSVLILISFLSLGHKPQYLQLKGLSLVYDVNGFNLWLSGSKAGRSGQKNMMKQRYSLLGSQEPE